MNEWKKVFLLVAFFAVASPELFTAVESPALRESTHTLLVDGLQRTYRLHVPPSYEEGRPIPLVLALHGGGGTGRGIERLTRGALPELSDSKGFILVAPDGVDRHWNDGRPLEDWRAHREDIDDVGFLASLVEQLAKRYTIDSKRVYALGISNGGMMSLRLACELSGKVAAVAAVAAAMPEALARHCSPPRPVSILLMNGTDDPLVPWNGGEIGFGRRRLGKVLSTPETIRFWLAKNKCSSAPVVTREVDRDPDDGSRVRREAYGNCGQETQVVLYAIEGGGHTWPRGAQHLSRFVVGKTNWDINAAEVIWRFFAQQARK